MSVDILNLIKSEHDRLRQKISSILESKNKTNKNFFAAFIKELSIHFQIEKDYIYPEAQAIFTVSSWVQKEQTNQDYILNQLENLDISTCDNKALEDLILKIRQHFIAEEDLLMPKFRSSMSFDQREEFGEALMDYQQELMQTV